MLSKIIVLLIALGTVRGQACPQSPVVLDLDVSRYLGRWFEIQVFPNTFQPNLACVSATYGYGGENNVTVYNEGVTL